MPLQPGSKLGPYQIEEPLGKGGMGEVWAALDPRVDRRVAIKVLPDDVARDRDRLARFEREAKALAALSHPNVATLFGLEEEGGQPFLVMELAPGETLEERIDRGPLRLEEALEVFGQLAEGLEAAHNRGLVHRDLKPANIKVDDEGRARILDFGLALALGDELDASSADATRSPTLTAGTAAGVLLGTAAYMAPEQARGKRVDPRADIWAWGCCLWQALTGKRPFAGDDVAMTLAAVLSQEPDFDQLPSDLPSALRTLLERCLEKDPRQRLQHIGEARWWLGQARLGDASPSQSDASAAAGAGRRLPLTALAIATTLVIGAAVGSWLTARAPTAAGTAPISYRFEVDGAAKLSGWSNLFGNQLAVRPNGTAFAYESREGIRLHDFAENRSHLVPGTEGGSDPVFSQDGERLAFWRDNVLHSTGLAGGPVQELQTPEVAEAFGPFGMTWRDGALLIGSGSGLWRIFEDGSPPVAVVSDNERALMFPAELPDGRIVYTPGQLDGRQIQHPMEIYDPADQRSRVLGIEGIGAHILSSGHLVWLHDGKLRATRWQDDDAEVQAGVAVLELDVEQSWASVPFALSRAGTLVSTSESELQLTWVRESGEKVVLPVETGFLRHPRWSPDGTRLAVTHGGVGSAHVLIVEVASGRISRLTESGVTVFPKWTWDDRIVFLDPLASAIMVAPWDRSESPKMLWEVPGEGFPGTPETVSPSGVVLFDGVPDFRRLNLDLPGESEPWLETQADELNISFSPDGRWVAYDSNESGRFQVYLRQFEGSPAAHVVSTDGGWSPAWSASGQELYFGSELGLKVVDVKIEGDSIDLGQPRLVEQAKGLSIDTDRNYDPHPAGDGFVVVEPAGATEFTVITNFESLVEGLLSGDEGD